VGLKKSLKKAKKKVKEKLPESPLNGVAKFLKDMTPEQKAKWQEEVRQRVKEVEEEEERKRNTPPSRPEGVCAVCGGVVRAHWHQGYSRPFHDIPIGPGSAQYVCWKFDGFSCDQCGLMYRFAPKAAIYENLRRLMTI
jgi:hypothetical protein